MGSLFRKGACVAKAFLGLGSEVDFREASAGSASHLLFLDVDAIRGPHLNLIRCDLVANNRQSAFGGLTCVFKVTFPAPPLNHLASFFHFHSPTFSDSFKLIYTLAYHGARTTRTQRPDRGGRGGGCHSHAQ